MKKHEKAAAAILILFALLYGFIRRKTSDAHTHFVSGAKDKE